MFLAFYKQERMNKNTIFQLKNVGKIFPTAVQATTVLKDISLEIAFGEFVIIFGPSGSGKSTLLHAMLGLESPTSGSIFFNAQDLYALNEDRRARLRKQTIGMVYQQPLWVHALNVIDNVALPLLLQGQTYEAAQQSALSVLKVIGMEKWATYQPTELSSGQQQRVSLARALIIKPTLIVADEPTGNLDYENGKQLLEKLVKINEVGTTVIMVTHDLSYLSYADRAYEIVNGQLKQTWTAAAITEKMKHHYWPTTPTDFET